MQARINNPVIAVPGAMQALQQLGKAARQAGLPQTTHYLVELRASQINGCAVCADMHSRELKAAGEPDECWPDPVHWSTCCESWWVVDTFRVGVLPASDGADA